MFVKKQGIDQLHSSLLIECQCSAWGTVLGAAQPSPEGVRFNVLWQKSLSSCLSPLNNLFTKLHFRKAGRHDRGWERQRERREGHGCACVSEIKVCDTLCICSLVVFVWTISCRDLQGFVCHDCEKVIVPYQELSTVLLYIIDFISKLMLGIYYYSRLLTPAFLTLGYTWLKLTKIDYWVFGPEHCCCNTQNDRWGATELHWSGDSTPTRTLVWVDSSNHVMTRSCFK